MTACGLLGRNLGHSYSPQIHGMLAQYEYKLFEVEPEELEAFLERGAFHGLNVTIPYKEAVLPYCQELSKRAADIGSVNTILRREDGSLWGDNTDATGFAWMLQSAGISVTGKKVLVLGSGGASRAVRYVLRELGAGEQVLVSRTGENHYGNLDKQRDAQVIVNTTPVGMYPGNGAAPIQLAQFPALEAVADLIYNPARTQLLLEAEKLGIRRVGGLPMLVGQARAAAECFSGERMQQALTEQVTRKIAKQMENLILIGMPGSGKTTIGEALARLTGRTFVDADQFVAEQAGCTIPEIFEAEGEDGFRRRETEALKELGKRSGLVIATGGGCVTRAENYAALHQNGRIIFLERAISDLARQGRPLSLSGDLEAMYLARLPRYKAFADLTLQNDGPPEAVAKKIWEGMNEIFGH